MNRHWSRRALRGVCVAALLMMLSVPVRSQSPTTGSVVGTVQDSAGAVIRDVLVTLTNLETGLSRDMFTDLRGRFGFALLPPGEYDVTVEKLAFGPHRLRSVPVRPGREVDLAVALAPVRGEVQATEATFPRGALQGSVAGQWVPEYGASTLPSARRDVAELARLTSQATDDMGVEGLPPWLSAIAIDGTAFRPAAHPYLWRAPFGTTAFSLGGIGAAELVTNGLDVEWMGVAGGVLSAHSRRGTPSLELDARGHWSGDVLPAPSFVDGSALSYNDLQGGIALRSPLLADSGRISLGVDVRQLQTPVAAAWGDSPAVDALITAGAGAGLELAANRSAALMPADAISAFGRFDWSVSRRHQVTAWLHFASLPQVSGFDPLTGALPELDGSDLLGGASLFSIVNPRVDNDLRVTLTSSRRSTAAIAPVAPTFVVGEGLSFGGARSPVTGEETSVQFRDAVHFRSGKHAVKLGAGVAIANHSYDYRQGADGEFYFSGVPELNAGQGVFVRADGPVAAATWTAATPTAFLQDRWSASEGLDVVLGVQVSHEPLPADRVQLDTEWESLSGLANTAAGSGLWLPAVRAGFTWDVQGTQDWIVHAGAGLYHDRSDPLLLSQWLNDDGDGRSRRDAGVVSWPQPGGGAGLRRLTLLAEDFAPPRTARLSAGLVHRLAPETSLQLTAVLRRTENLPRRTDLNLLPLPVARDQYNRAVFGTLSQRGAVLSAAQGSNRRFADYDEVAGVAADGRSDYWGITVGIDQALSAGTGFLARYTFSRTTDNWFGARDGGWTVARPQGLDAAGEWADGTSDFDVPHRAVASVVVAGPFASSLSAVYRFQSGQPFTPGYRAGVDADGDGAARNDPAFVDASLGGMNELFSRWPCLRDSAGRIAERNSCRGDATHALDVSLGVPLIRAGNTTASLIIDAFDLLATAGAQPDAALLLIDPAGTLTSDPVARTIDVPLVVNPNFGGELAGPHAGRKLRLGISLNW